MKKVLISVALVGLVSVAGAQTAFDRRIANVLLLQNPKVRTAVGISDAQRSQMNGAAEAHRRSLQAYEQKLKQENRDPRTVGPNDPTIRAAFVALRDSVMKVLKPAQVIRLREITLQSAGAAGLTDQVVATELGISGANLAKIRSTFDSASREMRGIQQQMTARALGPFKDRKPKNEAEATQIREQAQAALRREGDKATPQIKRIGDTAKTKILGYLTPAQNAKWQALQGKPFKA